MLHITPLHQKEFSLQKLLVLASFPALYQVESSIPKITFWAQSHGNEKSIWGNITEVTEILYLGTGPSYDKSYFQNRNEEI